MKVTKVAMKTPSGKIKTAPIGKTHASMHTTGQHGFILSDGSFAGREKAAKVANKAGQVVVKKLYSTNLKKV